MVFKPPLAKVVALSDDAVRLSVFSSMKFVKSFAIHLVGRWQAGAYRIDYDTLV